jgi:hypothetical protein
MFYIKEHVLEIKFKKKINLKIEWILFLTWSQIYQLTFFCSNLALNISKSRYAIAF